MHRQIPLHHHVTRQNLRQRNFSLRHRARQQPNHQQQLADSRQILTNTKCPKRFRTPSNRSIPESKN
jgi:hypothetical protein